MVLSLLDRCLILWLLLSFRRGADTDAEAPISAAAECADTERWVGSIFDAPGCRVVPAGRLSGADVRHIPWRPLYPSWPVAMLPYLWHGGKPVQAFPLEGGRCPSAHAGADEGADVRCVPWKPPHPSACGCHLPPCGGKAWQYGHRTTKSAVSIMAPEL